MIYETDEKNNRKSKVLQDQVTDLRTELALLKASH